MPAGLDNLKHIVTLMMENRSFDHMLGGLKAQYPAINGLTGNESNPDTTGAATPVQALAQFQGQLDPDPDHHFPAVDLQIFNGDQSSPRVASMSGFVNSYYQQQQNVNQSHKIMYYFKPSDLPVITTLATEFAVFNAWHASIPGPTVCNRAFAHFGSSFGQVSLDIFYVNTVWKSIYERMLAAGRTSKIYYYDEASSTQEIVNLLQSQPQLFATFPQFLSDCQNGALPDYSFVEPNYSDHDDVIASDQHPDHNVQAGEEFIATVYNAIQSNTDLFNSTALLIVWDEHGGIFDHVVPPACTPDGFVAQPSATGTADAFHFDRLGVRVPAVLVSPWVAKGTVVDGRTFEHASIPNTVTNFFIPNFDQATPNGRSPREKVADTYLDLLSAPVARTDCPTFNIS